MRHVAAACLLALVVLAAAHRPAGAVVVEGRFDLYGPIDWGASDPVPAPLLHMIPGPAPSAMFRYDTDAAIVLRQSDMVGRYRFERDASFALFLGGDTYAVTATPDNPLEIDVTGASRGNDYFAIYPLGGRGDPSNPFAAYPRLSMIYGTDIFTSGALPTASFAGCCYRDPAYFEDPELFLRSEAPRGPVGYYSIRFRLSSDVTVTTVAAPGGAAALLLLLAGLAGAARRRPAPAPIRR